MSTSKALDEWKSFLETTPPNTSLKIPGLAEENRRNNRWDFKTPQIKLHCEHDNGPSRHFSPMGLEKAALFGIKRFE